jgi:hypothetical protein
MCYNKLEEYRQEILRDTKYILLVISLCSFFLVVCIWAAFYSLIIGLAIGCIPLCVILLSLGWIKENNKLNYQISCICKAQCINKLQVIQLVDPKVSFKQKLVFRFHTSFNPHTFYGIKIVDGNKKYYYFFEQNVTLTDEGEIWRITHYAQDKFRIFTSDGLALNGSNATKSQPQFMVLELSEPCFMPYQQFAFKNV